MCAAILLKQARQRHEARLSAEYAHKIEEERRAQVARDTEDKMQMLYAIINRANVELERARALATAAEARSAQLSAKLVHAGHWDAARNVHIATSSADARVREAEGKIASACARADRAEAEVESIKVALKESTDRAVQLRAELSSATESAALKLDIANTSAEAAIAAEHEAKASLVLLREREATLEKELADLKKRNAIARWANLVAARASVRRAEEDAERRVKECELRACEMVAAAERDALQRCERVVTQVDEKIDAALRALEGDLDFVKRDMAERVEVVDNARKDLEARVAGALEERDEARRELEQLREKYHEMIIELKKCTEDDEQDYELVGC